MPAAKDGIWRNPKHGTSSGYKNYGCRCEKCRAWNAENQRRRRALKPEYFRKYAQRYYASQPERHRRENKRRYGITFEQYMEMFESQGGVCAICQQPEPNRDLAVDHDHACCPGQRSCGKCIRGLLCGGCNIGIGQFKEDPYRILRAIEYLKRTKLEDS